MSTVWQFSKGFAFLGMLVLFAPAGALADEMKWEREANASHSGSYMHFDYTAIVPTSSSEEAGIRWAGGPTVAGGFKLRNRPWLRFEGMASVLYAGATNGDTYPTFLDKDASHSFHVFGLANLYADRDILRAGGLGAYVGMGLGPYFTYVNDRDNSIRDSDAVLMFAGHAGLTYRFGGRTGRREAVLGYSYFYGPQDRRVLNSSGESVVYESQFHSVRLGLRMRY